MGMKTRKCSACGQVGHNSRNPKCPRRRRTMPTQTCSACGERGHNKRAKICTKRKVQTKSEMTCGKCKEKGHTAADKQCRFYHRGWHEIRAARSNESIITADEARQKVALSDIAEMINDIVNERVESKVADIKQAIFDAAK